MKQLKRKFNTVGTSGKADAKTYLFSEIGLIRQYGSQTAGGMRSFFYNGGSCGDFRSAVFFLSRDKGIPQQLHSKNKLIGDGIWTRCI